MKPRLTGFAACLLLLACSVPVVSRAQNAVPAVKAFSAVGSDPSELYYHAWKMCDEAEKLAQKQQYVEAIHKNRDALTILDAVARDHPQWRSAMVARRLTLIQEALKNWSELAKKQAGKQAADTPSRIEQGAGENGRKQAARHLPTFEELEEQRRIQGNSSSPGAGRRIPAYTPVSPVASVESSGSSYERMEQEITRLKLENDALIEALKDTKRDLFIAIKQKAIAEAGQNANQQRYDELEERLKQEQTLSNELVTTLTKQLQNVTKDLEESKTARQKAEEQVAFLSKQLEQSNEMLKEVTQERDSLRQERDQLAAIIELNSPEKTKNLLDTNLSLASRLKEAEAKIAKLENEKQQSEDMRAANLKELEATRAEVAQLKLRLASMYDENMGYRKRISELNTKLVNTEAELEKQAAMPKADPVAIEENRILRSAVSKQMRQLSTQVKSRELLIASYTRLKLKDPKMVEAMDMLNDDSKLKLTPAEEELLATIDKRSEEQREKEETEALKAASEQDKMRYEAEAAIKRQYELEAMGQAAEKAFNKGRYAAAEQLYKTLLDGKPDNFPARVNLGSILIKRNLVEEAIMHLKRAVEIDKDSATAQFLLGMARYRSGRDKEAMESFKEAVRIAPDNDVAMLCMGNMESSAEHFDQAIEFYQQAIKINPAFADAYYNMALIYARAKKFKEARAAYDKAVNAGSLPNPDLQKMLEQNTSPPPAQPVIAVSPEPEADGSPQPATPVDAPPAPASPQSGEQPPEQKEKPDTVPQPASQPVVPKKTEDTSEKKPAVKPSSEPDKKQSSDSKKPSVAPKQSEGKKSVSKPSTEKKDSTRRRSTSSGKKTTSTKSAEKSKTQSSTGESTDNSSTQRKRKGRFF